MLKTVRQILSLIIFLLGAAMLVWGLLPSRRQVLSQTIEPTSMQLPTDMEGATPTLLEVRQVQLEWPGSVRIGDQSEITLVFEPAASEILAPTPQGEFSNIYDRYNLMAEGRFEAAGILVDPANPRRESLPAGQRVRLKWSIKAEVTGNYHGNVWLSLRFLPMDGSSASQVPIFVREVDIRVTSLVGLGGPQARVVGGGGIIIGLALSYDVMIEMMRRWFNKKTQRSLRTQR